ncbi:hypothetical protein GF380_02855 [Candidatus Uhrbacteria bacterium]|nr:hypothetical protein [Candidatus Uhrbacteria bacterium]MBD3284089.1 hypothetical protein [Candidatus Uhrbacteria bacterium]
MFKLEDVIQLKPDEVIRMVTKRHVATIVPRLFFAFLLIVLPFFFLFPLFDTGPSGVVVFLVLVFVGLIVAYRTFRLWDGDVLILSNQRIIKVNQTGVFSRTVNEVAAEDIKEASWEKKGMISHLFNYGSVSISALQTIQTKQVPHPQEVHRYIQEVVDLIKEEQRKTVAERESRLKRVRSAVEDLDDEELLKLERVMKDQDRQKTIDEVFKPSEKKEIGAEESERSASVSSAKEARDITVKKLFGSDNGTHLKPLEDD